ncbi:MAG: phosphoglycerate kinase [Candidatus Omnitrophica bacterium]|nr:phosphoglycerate kinase [Candidatus Omnitrophota bacterium]
MSTNIAYAAPETKSIFKNKKVDYRKLSDKNEGVIQKKKVILTGEDTSRSELNKKEVRKVLSSHLSDLSLIHIPEELGKVVEVYQNPDQDRSKLVVHIQDLHTNPEASLNLAKILDILLKDYKMGLVCSEGADGIVDTSSVSGFPDVDVREKVARLFIDSGELTGEEYLSITKYPELPIWGIENKDIYFKNIVEFNNIMKFNPDSQVFISQIKKALEELKPKIYSKELLAIDQKELDYDNQKIETVDYLKHLSIYIQKLNIPTANYKNIALLDETMGKESKIDQQKIMQESQSLLLNLQSAITGKSNRSDMDTLMAKARLFKDQKISSFSFYSYLKDLANRRLKGQLSKYPNLMDFVDYLTKVNSLDSTKLFIEMGELTYEIKQRLARNDEEKALTQNLRNIKFLEGFFNLKVSNEELDYYLENRGSHKTGYFEGFLKPAIKKYNISSFVDFKPDLVDSHLQELEDFYKTAKSRDLVMFNNSVSEIEKRNIKVSALISGGFHTKGLTRLLKDKGYSYIVISPFSKTEIDEENYHFLLSGKRRPIEELINQLDLSKPTDKVSRNLRVPLASDRDMQQGEQRSSADRIKDAVSLASNHGISEISALKTLKDIALLAEEIGANLAYRGISLAEFYKRRKAFPEDVIQRELYQLRILGLTTPPGPGEKIIFPAHIKSKDIDKLPGSIKFKLGLDERGFDELTTQDIVDINAALFSKPKDMQKLAADQPEKLSEPKHITAIVNYSSKADITDIKKDFIVGKRVLLLIDANVGKTDVKLKPEELNRVRNATGDIANLLRAGAKQVDIMSHNGSTKDFRNDREDGEPDPSFSLERVAELITENLHKEGVLGRDEQVGFINDSIGQKTAQYLDDRRDGSVVMLENTRFYKDEGDGTKDKEAIRQHAQKILDTVRPDIIVNAAAGAYHRGEQASRGLVGEIANVPYVMGLLGVKELSVIRNLMENPTRDVVLIMGGAKGEDKIRFMETLVEGGIADKIVVGGKLILPFINNDEVANRIRQKAESRPNKPIQLIIPEKVIVAKLPDGMDDDKFAKELKKGTITSYEHKSVFVKDIEPGWTVLDADPDDIKKQLGPALENAGTIIKNGTMGLGTLPNGDDLFNRSNDVVNSMVVEKKRQDKKVSVNGFGGDGVAEDTAYLIRNNIDPDEIFDMMSTMGGAGLQYMSGAKLSVAEKIDTKADITRQLSSLDDYKEAIERTASGI